MATDQKYSVIELAELVGVPRTTINDWLNKYAPYIEFMMQGKRRIYTENTLNVLKKVSELRNQGISLADIETELSKEFAVHPQPQTQEDLPGADFGDPGNSVRNTAGGVFPGRTGHSEKDASSKNSSDNNTMGLAAEKNVETSGNSVRNNNADSMSSPVASVDYALISKQNSEEIARAVGERFQAMLEKIDRMDQDSARTAKRTKCILMICAVLTLALVTVCVYAYVHGNRSREESVRQGKVLTEMKSAMDSRDQTIQKLSDTADSLNRQTDALKENIVRMEENYHKSLEENRKNYVEKRAAELKQQKELFDAERAKIHQEMQDRDRIARDHEAYIDELQTEIDTLRQNVSKDVLEKIEKDKILKSQKGPENPAGLPEKTTDLEQVESPVKTENLP